MSTYANKTLARFNRVQFADWLWRGLQSFYAAPPANRSRAFDHVGLLIRQQESVSEGLARVYEDHVPKSRQLLFRLAIGDVLRNQGNTESAPWQAFQDLIYLLARIRATESLNSLLPTVGAGILGERHPEILYETLAVLKSLAPSMQAYETARDLVDSRNFDDGYLFEALKVLVECQPSLVPKTLLGLLPRLTDLRNTAHKTGGDEWNAFCEAAGDFVSHILSLTPSSWIRELLEQAGHMPDQMWFFELVFNNKTVPVYLVRNESSDQLMIEYSGKKSPLKVLRRDFRIVQRLSIISAYNEVNCWVTSPMDPVHKIRVEQVKKTGQRLSQSNEEESNQLGVLLRPKLKQLAPPMC